MSKPERNLPKTVMEQLAETANTFKMLNGNRTPTEKPGELIKSLGPVKRQILKQLKSEDIENVRWPR
jgi:hypothetical protein